MIFLLLAFWSARLLSHLPTPARRTVDIKTLLISPLPWLIALCFPPSIPCFRTLSLSYAVPVPGMLFPPSLPCKFLPIHQEHQPQSPFPSEASTLPQGRARHSFVHS